MLTFSRSTTNTDVGRRADVAAAAKEAIAKAGTIDFVVNTAGVLPRGELLETTEETVYAATEINYLGPIFIAQEFYPHLAASKGALLLFTSSSYTRGRSGYSLYSSAKAATVNLTQALADEWADAGVRVNCINPERTATPMRTKAFGQEAPGTLLVVGSLTTTGLLQGGEAISLAWTTRNIGSAPAADIREKVYLSRDGVVGSGDILLGERSIASLAAGASSAGSLGFTLPVDLSGAWRLIVVTDTGAANNESTQEGNNQDSLAIDVAQDAYADLAVLSVSAPTRVIADPASITVEWTVKNEGPGAGRATSWTDRIIYSTNAVLGDQDDIVLGDVVRNGALAAGDSYTGHLDYQFGPAFRQDDWGADQRCDRID